MSTLIVLNRNPYDGTDVTWNALRLAEKLREDGELVRLFLMNDSVDLARDTTRAPEGYFDLVQMTKALFGKEVTVKVCGTCQARCGIHNHLGLETSSERSSS
jgi:uncharacterized protein involved in oxidation of intracellular sulfur